MKKREVARLRVLSLCMSVAMLCTNVPANMIGSVIGSDVGALSNVSAASTDYGLMDNIQDGTILHCFDWKYSDIEAELENIAEAGFTSIQTSPAQRNNSFDSPWYMMYQPQNFAISTNPLGTKEELQSLCEEAEKYGIKVIVDVVANHTRGMEGENGDIDNDLRNRDFFRYDNENLTEDWKSRYYVYSTNIGMRDLKSENLEVQKIVSDYVLELESVGVDGIRWDAAKHIQLPSEGSQFWPAVTSQGLFHYGEILTGPMDGNDEQEKEKIDKLMREYTEYMTVTDDMYGHDILYSLVDKKIPETVGNYSHRGVAKDKLIYWPESHDTYTNNGEYDSATQVLDQNVVDRAYAILAAQDQATSLYFLRPEEKTKETIMPGVKGSTHFTSPEVAAVNHFHNAMSGQKEYYVKDTTYNNAAVYRENGAVIVKADGTGYTEIANGGGTTAPGTYIDEITGNEWTVTETTISGTVGESGIAVFYKKVPYVSISRESGLFDSETLELTIQLNNATSGTYKIGAGEEQEFTSEATITIGDGMLPDEAVVVEVTATDGIESVIKSYSYIKSRKTIDGSYDIYCIKPDGWGTAINCYAYTDSGSNVGWPGVAMDDLGNGIYGYNLPDDWTTAQVIFNDGSNQYPESGQPGLDCTNDVSVIFKNYALRNYEEEVTNISLDKTSATLDLCDTVTLTATVTSWDEADKRVTWTSSNNKVATVVNGVVTAKGEGETTITATTRDGQKATATITVQAAGTKVESVQLDQEVIMLEVDEIAQISATMNPSDADAKYTALTWISSNNQIATVDNDGKVTGVGSGVATITARTKTGVVAVAEVVITKKEVLGDALYFEKPWEWGSGINAYIWSENGEWKNAEWPGVAMTKIDNGIYAIQWPEGKEGESLNVIFNDGVNQTNDLVAQINGYCILNDAQEGCWKQGTVIVCYVNEKGEKIAKSQTHTGNIGASYSIAEEQIEGYILKETPKNASGTYRADEIIVTYVYEEDGTMEAPSEEIQVTGISISGEPTELCVGDTTVFMATITLSDATDISVTWTSSDEQVVTVTDGVVMAMGSGKATITATAASGVSDSVEVVVSGRTIDPPTDEPKEKEIQAILSTNSSYTYDGTAQRAGVTVTYEGKTLIEGTDYILTYENNVNAGTATGSTISKIAHKWNTGVVTKEATETEAGVKTYTCTSCNETKTESIPKVEVTKPVRYLLRKYIANMKKKTYTKE